LKELTDICTDVLAGGKVSEGQAKKEVARSSGWGVRLEKQGGAKLSSNCRRVISWRMVTREGAGAKR